MNTLTQGAFDITLHSTIDAWGFDAGKPQQLAATAPQQPSITPNSKSLALAGEWLSKQSADVRINLSGIAKGYGVDALFRLAQQQGIQNFLAEIGGEVRVKGSNPSQQPWHIAIENPDHISSHSSTISPIAVAQLTDGQALATSGNYRNCRQHNGKTICHILDPRTAAPAMSHFISVSIVAPDCMTADALATASMVMGVQQTTKLLQQLPQVHALFVTRHPQTQALQVSYTPKFPLIPGSV
ncbi:MAG: FAD:protein FMN transferase [Myxococcota bacterium]